MGKKKEELNEEVAATAAAVNPEENENEVSGAAPEENEASGASLEGNESGNEDANDSDDAASSVTAPEGTSEEENKTATEDNESKDAEPSAISNPDDVVTPGQEEKIDDQEASDQLPSAEDDAAVDHVVETTEPGEVLTGSFKVYRGRNLATITAMATTVVRDGEVIEENGIKWLPVVFNNKGGTLSKGFIILR